jgi:hypothetical protein
LNGSRGARGVKREAEGRKQKAGETGNREAKAMSHQRNRGEKCLTMREGMWYKLSVFRV